MKVRSNLQISLTVSQKSYYDKDYESIHTLQILTVFLYLKPSSLIDDSNASTFAPARVHPAALFS